MDYERLINAYFDDPDLLSDEQVKGLSLWLIESIEHAKLYISYLRIHQSIYRQANTQESLKYVLESASCSDTALLRQDSFNQELWDLLAKEEREALPVCMPRSENCMQGVNNQIVQAQMARDNLRPVRKIPWLTIGFSAVAVLILGVLSLIPVSKPCAVLVDAIDPKWANASDSLEIGQVIYKTDKLNKLNSGFVKIAFESGATIVIEGPSAFMCTSDNSLYVDQGQLFSYVPRRASGFKVASPSSEIVDLGTEFGVKVQFDGTSIFHMISGKGRLISKASGNDTGEHLGKNTARRIDSQSGQIHNSNFDEFAFVRNIDSETNFLWRGWPLDLADVVGGGNGFGTGQLNAGIDPMSGELTTQLSYFMRVIEGSRYVAVPSSSFIDGVFAVVGREIQTDSHGHILMNSPQTDGLYWTQITNGALVGLDADNLHPATIGGVQYGTKENPSILMVSNVGITFDLDAIRSSLPGIQISGFQCGVGLSETVMAYANRSRFVQSSHVPRVAFTVVVDGRLRFQEKNIVAEQSIVPVLVEISSSDRYLTLIATDGGDNIFLDWFICANPVLNLSLI